MVINAIEMKLLMVFNSCTMCKDYHHKCWKCMTSLLQVIVHQPGHHHKTWLRNNQIITYLSYAMGWNIVKPTLTINIECNECLKALSLYIIISNQYHIWICDKPIYLKDHKFCIKSYQDLHIERMTCKMLIFSFYDIVFAFAKLQCDA